ncbi:MAG: hypothetical protein ACP5OA_07005 [Candidatus Woesearchaeota archaeon]
MKNLLLLLVFLIMLNSVYAWSSYTHNWICDRAGLTENILGIDCANADYDEMKSRYKDLASVHHHCTNNGSDCAARVYADKQAMYSYPEAAGFAAHLYADSMTPVHWYSTDYKTCHKIFEDKVEEKLRNTEHKKYIVFGKEYDFSAWNITMYCPAKFGKENRTVELYASNYYMDSVADYVAEKMHSETAPKESRVYDMTPILMLILILILLVFILFIYYGMKNSRK